MNKHMITFCILLDFLLKMSTFQAFQWLYFDGNHPYCSGKGSELWVSRPGVTQTTHHI